MPLPLCIVGAGNHSRLAHLPALAHYRTQHPDRISLTSIVDSDQPRARELAAEFNIGNVYRSIDEMLEREAPGACVAVTPVSINAGTAIGLMRRGIPTLMEKPIGTSLAEAREVVAVAAQTGSKIMVSMNRRFDPLFEAAREWIGTKEVHLVRATMARRCRTEPNFLEETGVHLIDAVLSAMGPVEAWKASQQRVGGTSWFQIHLDFAGGARGLIDLMPTAGANAERVEFYGETFRVEVGNARFDRNLWQGWEMGKLTGEGSVQSAIPDFIANGTYRETEVFLAGVLENRPLHPTPADVLPSVELSHVAAHAAD